jgi:hypothetical protein
MSSVIPAKIGIQSLSEGSSPGSMRQARTSTSRPKSSAGENAPSTRLRSESVTSGASESPPVWRKSVTWPEPMPRSTPAGSTFHERIQLRPPKSR